MIAIIRYSAGNIVSVKNVLKRLGVLYLVTSKPMDIYRADKVIFPGVGRSGSTMVELKRKGLDRVIKEIKVPFLGICLGMQLLSQYSEEDGTRCLSIIPGEVNKFPRLLKVPQIGWNSVNVIKDSPLLEGIPNGSYFYFVNSFYFDTDEKFVYGKTSYGLDFASVIQRDNFYATQFHPEKSSFQGLKLIYNFCERC